MIVNPIWQFQGIPKRTNLAAEFQANKKNSNSTNRTQVQPQEIKFHPSGLDHGISIAFAHAHWSLTVDCSLLLYIPEKLCKKSRAQANTVFGLWYSVSVWMFDIGLEVVEVLPLDWAGASS